MNKISACILIAGTAVVVSCNSNGSDSDADSTQPVRTVFLEPGSIDSSAKPGDNFWLFANGAWNKTAVIPATENSVGSFNDLAKANRKALQKLCADAAADTKAAKGSIEQKVGDLYKSGMDTAKIDQLNYQPIQPELTAINNLADYKQMLQWVAQQHAFGNDYLYSFYVAPDDKNAAVMIPAFSQGCLGLPDRDYYFKTDAKSKELRDSYKTYITKLFSLTGDDTTTAAKNAASVITVETGIANGHFDNVELRDPQKNYNKLSETGLEKLAPAIDWKTTFNGLQMKQDSFLVGQLKFFQNLNGLVTKMSIADWKQYLRFHVVTDAAPYLSKAFDDARFNFYGKTLSGQQQQKPRAERIAQIVDGSLGEALGQLYVKKYFNDNARKRMDTLVNNLQAVYKKRIQGLDWMSDSTKQIAISKLEAFTKKIGFPDKWKEYKIDIAPND